MAEVFKYHKKQKMYFNVEVDDELVKLPIGSSMPVGLYDKLANISELSKILTGDADNITKLRTNTKIYNDLVAIYKLVIPTEQFEKLGFITWSIDDLVGLFNAWQMTALKVQGITLGESQASASS